MISYKQEELARAILNVQYDAHNAVEDVRCLSKLVVHVRACEGRSGIERETPKVETVDMSTVGKNSRARKHLRLLPSNGCHGFSTRRSSQLITRRTPSFGGSATDTKKSDTEPETMVSGRKKREANRILFVGAL